MTLIDQRKKKPKKTHHDAYTMLFLYVKWNTMVELKTLIKIVRNYFDYFGICKPTVQ